MPWEGADRERETPKEKRGEINKKQINPEWGGPKGGRSREEGDERDRTCKHRRHKSRLTFVTCTSQKRYTIIPPLQYAPPY